ncbi:PorP/SprF family type IX secretion system membrane protein [Paramuribaculum intestinale]|uniref:PorP/SprF family type IX secretion system membrane protein n=1 Tax=Paramuribaculum intestinale TaxID=2094151 RepID=UPI00272A4138|nr:PorP/SprF family type IX secretion system membrane protein [Paramuribaculum intestinale]
MMRRLYTSLALGLSLSSAPVIAQTDPLLSQYYEVKSFYNPAATGTTDLMRFKLGSRMQWTGIDNAPRAFIGVADSPFRLAGKRFGAGIAIRQEKQGLYDDLNMGLQLSYHIKLAGGYLAIGVQPGVLNEKFRGSEVYIPADDEYHDDTDEAIPRVDVSGSALDIGAGIYYSRRNFWASASMTHLNAPTVTFSTDSPVTSRAGEDESDENGSSPSSGSNGSAGEYEFHARRTLYLMTGGNIPISSTLFELMPSAMMATDFRFTRLSLTARLRWKKMVSLGVGYRHDDTLSVSLSGEFRGFFLGYAYDYPTGKISVASSGSHEIFAGYAMKLDLGEKNRHKQKSIRFM